MNKPYCCNEESTWIENVPGKGYHFCQVCRNEVLESYELESIDPKKVLQAQYDAELEELLDNIYIGRSTSLKLLENIIPNDPDISFVPIEKPVDTY
jgi:hypothetical protein